MDDILIGVLSFVGVGLGLVIWWQERVIQRIAAQRDEAARLLDLYERYVAREGRRHCGDLKAPRDYDPRA